MTLFYGINSCNILNILSIIGIPMIYGEDDVTRLQVIQIKDAPSCGIATHI